MEIFYFFICEFSKQTFKIIFQMFKAVVLIICDLF